MEIYNFEEEGYHPFLINKNWQVAKLNYCIEQKLTSIDKMEKHIKTDEVFILLEGEAILIEAKFVNGWEFYFYRMEKNKIYNVKAGVWHNIILFKGAETLIIEKNNTHLNDCTYKSFLKNDRDKLRSEYLSYCNL